MKCQLANALLLSALLALPINAADPKPRAPLPDDLAAVPGDALGFIHIRVADIWKSDALKELRETVMKAGEKALVGFDKRFVPTPSSIDRLTLVFVPRDRELRGEPAFYAVLSVNKPFDREQLLKSAMPNAVEEKTANGSFWNDPASRTALAFINDRIFVFGSSGGVELFVQKRSGGDGPLNDALYAIDGKRHITAGANLTLIPEKAARDLPPSVSRLLRAKTALLSLDLAENTQIDLSLNFEDDRAAAAGHDAVDELAKMGREFLKKGREEMLQTVLGDGKLAPLEKLPEAAMALVALGGMDRLDAFLAKPPVKRDGKVVKMSVAVPNFNYATTAPIAVGLLLPAVQKVREAAGRTQSMNNLKQFGLAFNNYNDQYNMLPAAAICDKNGKALLSWRVAILPFIEQQNLYNQFKLDEPWDSEHNKKLIPLMPKMYLDPLAPPGKEPGLTHYQVVWGDDAAISQIKSRSIQGIPDGSSNTGVVFEMADGIVWTKPDDVAYDKKKPLPKFAAFSNGGFLMVCADGSARLMPRTTPEKTIRNIIEANDGNVVDWP